MNNNIKDEVNVKIDNLIIKAMNSELKAKKFYEDASAKAESQAGKKLFNELAHFEHYHYERVKKIIQSRKKGIKFENPKSVLDDIKIGSEIEGEFEPNKDEIVSVINLAIKAEKKAQERYIQIAEMFKDDENKNIFNDFAREERNHQRILEDEFYQLSNKGTIIWDY